MADAPVSIAMCTPPFMGHAIPLVRMAEKLLERGHRVTFFTFDVFMAAIAKALPETAERVVVPTSFETQKALEEHCLAYKGFPAEPLNVMGMPHLKEMLPRCSPDLILADFFLAPCCSEICRDLKLPMAISFPGPLELLNALFCFGPNPKLQTSCCGLHMGFGDIAAPAFLSFFNIMGVRTFFSKVGVAIGSSLVLVQSHWGLDPPRAVPANIKVVGAVTDPPKEALQVMESKAPELSRWLSQPGPPVVYVTTGSMANLKEWQVRALWGGLKKAGVRVVWSLKEEQQALVPEDADFFIRSWLPQAELLHREEIQCVITHCGWGGSLEITGAGKPAVGMPFTADQPGNLKLLLNAGMAEPIGKIPPQFGGDLVWKEGMITEESVAAAVGKILSEPRYAENAKRVSVAAQGMGGAKECAFLLEMGARHGVKHCCDAKTWRRTTGGNPLSLIASGCVAGLALAACGLCGAL